MYNWDEKGFLIGLARTLKCIMTKKMYDSGSVKTATVVGVRAIQDHKVIEWNTCWKCRLSEGSDDK